MTGSATTTDAAMDAFLTKPRYGILATSREDGTPIAVPVWFEWDGSIVRMFSRASSPKVRRLQRDARASLLVANDVDELEAWIAFDGTIAISDEGAIELAERLAPRYWDLSDPGRKGMLEVWRKGASAFRMLELTPNAIRTYGTLA